MSEDLGIISGCEFTVSLTPALEKYFHKGVTGTTIIGDELYKMKVKYRHKKNNTIRVKCNILY